MQHCDTATGTKTPYVCVGVYRHSVVSKNPPMPCASKRVEALRSFKPSKQAPKRRVYRLPTPPKRQELPENPPRPCASKRVDAPTMFQTLQTLNPPNKLQARSGKSAEALCLEACRCTHNVSNPPNPKSSKQAPSTVGEIRRGLVPRSV